MGRIFSAFGRRSCILLGAALMCAGIFGVERAQATITLQETSEAVDPALQAEGWMGIKLSLVSDSGRTVAGMDFKNDVNINGTWVFPKTEPIGISGPVYQEWTPTKFGVVSTPSRTSIEADTSGEDDSFFVTSGILHTADSFTENNDLSIDGTTGVGSFMTFSGTVNIQEQLSTLDIAFLIVPANQDNVVIRGLVIDSSGYYFGIDDVLNPGSFSGSSSVQAFALTGAVPEPATMGIGVLMCALLLKRRRAGS